LKLGAEAGELLFNALASGGRSLGPFFGSPGALFGGMPVYGTSGTAGTSGTVRDSNDVFVLDV
jgi:hypothetical protein